MACVHYVRWSTPSTDRRDCQIYETITISIGGRANALKNSRSPNVRRTTGEKRGNDYDEKSRQLRANYERKNLCAMKRWKNRTVERRKPLRGKTLTEQRQRGSVKEIHVRLYTTPTQHSAANFSDNPFQGYGKILYNIIQSPECKKTDSL